MILTDKIKIKISKKNIEHFKNIGMDVKLKDIIEINPILLNKGSHVKIKVKCDICEKIKELSFQKYIKNIKNENFYACSSKCAQEKVKKTSIKNFGEEYYTKTKEYKERVQETSIKNYGCEHHTQNEQVKDKIKKTNLEKYGCENVFQNEEIKEKIKNTNIELYGTENPFQSEIIKDKMRKTFLEKYGVDWASKSEIVKEKSKETNLKKYGVEYHFNLDWVRDKAKKSYFDKYGLLLGTMTKEMRIKVDKNKKEKWIKQILEHNTNLKYINILPDKKLYTFECEFGHIFEIPFSLSVQRNYTNTIMCTICNPIEKHISGLEIQLTNFIKENYIDEIIENSKKIINPYELDIYLPDLKLAFEFNGLFWHCEYQRADDFHLMKTELCEKQRIQLIHIYEDDWMYKQDIVKSRILNLLGKNPNKIYARKCVVKKIKDNKIVKDFLEINHIQGFIGSRIKLGLYYNDELVSLMIFAKIRKPMRQNSQDGYEMLRFCNKLNTSVIDGSSKLFKYFIDNYKPKEIISYADRSWSQGNLYKKLGFNFIHKTPPNYYYIIDKTTRKHRFNYRKDILVKQGFDKNKTEHEIMLERNLYRIYDSGGLKFVWKPNQP